MYVNNTILDDVDVVVQIESLWLVFLKMRYNDVRTLFWSKMSVSLFQLHFHVISTCLRFIFNLQKSSFFLSCKPRLLLLLLLINRQLRASSKAWTAIPAAGTRARRGGRGVPNSIENKSLTWIVRWLHSSYSRSPAFFDSKIVIADHQRRNTQKKRTNRTKEKKERMREGNQRERDRQTESESVRECHGACNIRERIQFLLSMATI